MPSPGFKPRPYAPQSVSLTTITDWRHRRCVCRSSCSRTFAENSRKGVLLPKRNRWLQDSDDVVTATEDVDGKRCA
ncbi:hypothetical protein TNCV_233291 [Trichonephila clavipes]|nr:hypothetical protein TNCV_233291 [Trichonephila clavipes]